MTTFTGGVGKQWERAQSLYEDMTISNQTWMYFAILFGLGVFFLFCASMALPFLVFAPSKFASSFTLGSVFILSSFIVLGGWKKFYEHMTETKEKKWISMMYIG